jgi:hypothetical protein
VLYGNRRRGGSVSDIVEIRLTLRALGASSG